MSHGSKTLREKTCDPLDFFEQPFFYSSMRDKAISNTALLDFFCTAAFAAF